MDHLIKLTLMALLVMSPMTSQSCYYESTLNLNTSHLNIISVNSEILKAADAVNTFDEEPKTYVLDLVSQDLTNMISNGKKNSSSEQLESIYNLINFALSEPHCKQSSSVRAEDLVCIIQTPQKTITISKLTQESQRYYLIGIYNVFKSTNLLDLSLAVIHSLFHPQKEGLKEITLNPLISFAILSRQRLYSHLQGVQFYGVGFNFESLFPDHREFIQVDFQFDICLTPRGN